MKIRGTYSALFVYIRKIKIFAKPPHGFCGKPGRQYRATLYSSQPPPIPALMKIYI